MPFSWLLSENNGEERVDSEGVVKIAEVSLRRLRAAIQNHEVSFPSQVPIFACQSRADIQWRMVELYFVHNWSCTDLGERYGVTMERARQLVSQWVRRAVLLGYLQPIPALEETVSHLSESGEAELAPAAVLPPGPVRESVVLAASH